MQHGARRARRLRRVAAAATTVLALSGCTSPFSDDSSVSAFSLEVGQCLMPEEDATTAVGEVPVVPCDEPHTQEVYAVVEMPTDGEDGEAFPGAAALTRFADGTCAERYEAYVGTPYPDSSLYFTYLLPSARSWDQGEDREVVCLVTTTGETLETSVKGSRR